ncbi:MAG: hypothetical protein LUQ11_14455 [Methylococcaceae bacterium]|nr:hypothetical protein [Methylococcaceae bacterium]
MDTNNFPVLADKDFSVRPEPVEGWTGKSGLSPRQTVHASTVLSTNGLAGTVDSGSNFWRNPKDNPPKRFPSKPGLRL